MIQKFARMSGRPLETEIHTPLGSAGFQWFHRMVPHLVLVALASILLSGATGLAENSDLIVGEEKVREAPEVTVTVEPVSEIGLDQLLALPNAASYGQETRQGGTPQKWRRRFLEARRDIAAAQKRIDEARAKMDEMSGGGTSQWQMAPPGAAANTDAVPMSLEQREEIRAGKQDLEDAERALRALIIEADLGSVPQSWRDFENSAVGSSVR